MSPFSPWCASLLTSWTPPSPRGNQAAQEAEPERRIFARPDAEREHLRGTRGTRGTRGLIVPTRVTSSGHA